MVNFELVSEGQKGSGTGRKAEARNGSPQGFRRWCRGEVRGQLRHGAGGRFDLDRGWGRSLSARIESLVSLLGAAGSHSMILSVDEHGQRCPLGRASSGQNWRRGGCSGVCVLLPSPLSHPQATAVVVTFFPLPSVSSPAISRSKNRVKTMRCSEVLDCVVCSLLRREVIKAESSVADALALHAPPPAPALERGLESGCQR